MGSGRKRHSDKNIQAVAEHFSYTVMMFSYTATRLYDDYLGHKLSDEEKNLAVDGFAPQVILEAVFRRAIGHLK